ncbi:aldo/keto reductase [Mariniphaga sediminis]|jgi:aryl-alcohol dehydrogenase-like predicted oxidoreductase|uniref:Aldo/keto reductase n=1 Tax=Mariniphaga sediminis TaxID=1628158 RepID=A0A399D9Y1_9BACT|nr:aldo/keto reductase [Mariniphaga sediminis]RIH67062.1 aldo/keto reductase [Mariniphaga sediminis]
MKKRPLGNTGIHVSEIAFGGVEIGMPYGIGVENAADMLSESEAIELLHAALDAGINFFDTARMYGESEAIMGKAFKHRRDEVVLCTKCRHLIDDKGKIPSGSALKEFIEGSLNESLRALQTDSVDVFMLHQVNFEILENEEIASIFLNLKKEGKIKATGASVYTPEETQKAIATGVWDVLQIPFNLMDQRQETFFSQAKEKGVGLVVRSVLMKGLLSDRGKNLHPALKKVEQHIAGYGELMQRTSFDLPMLATKFALSFPEVSSILVGIDRKEYLEQSLEAADGSYLEEETMQRAKQMAFPEPDFLNLHHWSKMNWLK